MYGVEPERQDSREEGDCQEAAVAGGSKSRQTDQVGEAWSEESNRMPGSCYPEDPTRLPGPCAPVFFVYFRPEVTIPVSERAV